jgi:ornithine cyclodeaminase
LARADAGDLAVIGSGVQARTHLVAMAEVRRLRSVRVWSPTPARLRAFAEEAASIVSTPIEVAKSARDAVRGADLICCVTSSRTPVLEGEWIARGAHVNAIGASTPDTRELDTAAIANARVYVDRRESALAEAGDILIPLNEAAIGPDHIRGELGELLMGSVRGRENPDDVTVFKSLGLAIEDAAAAHHVHAAAVRAGLGTEIDLKHTHGEVLR